MKKKTKQEIDSVRNWMENQKFPEVDVKLGGLKFSYFILPQSINPDLPDFVCQFTGDPEDGAVFGISESVPEQFRKYAVAHEVIEFTQIGRNVKGRCYKALEKEISLVPEPIKSDYIKMRKDFFKKLIPYAEANNYPKGDIKEFKGSLSHLERLTGE